MRVRLLLPLLRTPMVPSLSCGRPWSHPFPTDAHGPAPPCGRPWSRPSPTDAHGPALPLLAPMVSPLSRGRPWSRPSPAGAHDPAPPLLAPIVPPLSRVRPCSRPSRSIIFSLFMYCIITLIIVYISAYIINSLMMC